MLNFCPWSPEPHASCWLRYRPPCTTIIYRPPTVQCWNVLLAGFYIYYHFADILGTGHCVWGPLSDLGDAHFGLAVAAWPFYHSPLHLCLPMFCEYGVETIFKHNKWRLYQLTCLVFPFFFCSGSQRVLGTTCWQGTRKKLWPPWSALLQRTEHQCHWENLSLPDRWEPVSAEHKFSGHYSWT